jgi:hypothetical protein
MSTEESKDLEQTLITSSYKQSCLRFQIGTSSYNNAYLRSQIATSNKAVEGNPSTYFTDSNEHLTVVTVNCC